MNLKKLLTATSLAAVAFGAFAPLARAADPYEVQLQQANGSGSSVSTKSLVPFGAWGGILGLHDPSGNYAGEYQADYFSVDGSLVLDSQNRIFKVGTILQSNVQDLVSSLNAKVNLTDYTTALAGKASSTHTHSISSINGLVSALLLKADASHWHPDASATSSGMMSLPDKLKLDALSTSTATAVSNGLMSAEDKAKLNALGTSSPVYNNSVSRTLNSAFQVSATRTAAVSYTVDVAATISISGGQSGTVHLEYADDSGFTTNVRTVQSSVNGNTGTLTIGLSLTQTASASLTGMIPAGKYVRIRTVNTTGTPTFTYRLGQEVLQ